MRGDRIVGNLDNKYHTNHPIARRLVAGFLQTVAALARPTKPRSVLDVGCGEGYLAEYLLNSGLRPERFEACDLSDVALADTLDPLICFRQASIYELPYGDAEFDLVLCCEVLEHLERPQLALAELARVARRSVLVSVPREPLWCFLNLLRGRYVSRLGNTPGHQQHFSRRRFLALAAHQLDIVAVRGPIPWTVALGKPRSAHKPGDH